MLLQSDLPLNPSSDDIVGSLRRAILAHRVAPGSKLVEDEVRCLWRWPFDCPHRLAGFGA